MLDFPEMVISLQTGAGVSLTALFSWLIQSQLAKSIVSLQEFK